MQRGGCVGGIQRGRLGLRFSWRPGHGRLAEGSAARTRARLGDGGEVGRVAVATQEAVEEETSGLAQEAVEGETSEVEQEAVEEETSELARELQRIVREARCGF